MSCNKRLWGIHNYILLSNRTTINIACALQKFLSSAPVLILSPWQLQGCDITVDITGCYRTETKALVLECLDLNGCTKRREEKCGDRQESCTKPTLPEQQEQGFKNHSIVRPQQIWHHRSKHGLEGFRRVGRRVEQAAMVRFISCHWERSCSSWGTSWFAAGACSWPENGGVRARCNCRMLYTGKGYVCLQNPSQN